MTKEALKLALEALETPWNAPYVDGCDLALGKKVKAITAIKEALAEPEQKPIGTVKELFTQAAWERLDLKGSTAVYITPPQRTWVGLTDEEMQSIAFESADALSAVFVAEAKLKAKNT